MNSGQDELTGGRFVLEMADAALDGGSIFLGIRDRGGRQHRVELVQWMFLAPADPARLSGRLYVDDELIAVRSEEERMTIEGLKEAMSNSPDVPAGRQLVGDLLRFVESERYVSLARTTSQQK